MFKKNFKAILVFALITFQISTLIKAESLTFEKPDLEFTLKNGLDVILKKVSDEPGIYAKLGFKNIADINLAYNIKNKGKVPYWAMINNPYTAKGEELNKLFIKLNVSCIFGKDGCDYACSSTNFNEVTKLIFESLTSAQCPQKILDEDKQELHKEYKELQNDFLFVLQEAAEKHFYHQHTWFKSNEEMLINCKYITREDLLNFHKEHVNPQKMFLVVVGDFDLITIKKEITNIFEKWENKSPAKKPINITIPPIKIQSSTEIITQGSINETIIYACHLFPITCDPKNYYSNILLKLYTHVLFSKTQNPLIQYIDTNFNIIPTLKINDIATEMLTFNRVISKDEIKILINEIKMDLKDYAQKGMSNEYLMLLKKKVLLELSKSLKISKTLKTIYAELKSKDIKLNFVHQALEEIKNITLEDVNKVAKQYLNPDEWSFFILEGN